MDRNGLAHHKLALCGTHDGLHAGWEADMLCLVDGSAFDPPSLVASRTWLVDHNDLAGHSLVFHRNHEGVVNY